MELMIALLVTVVVAFFVLVYAVLALGQELAEWLGGKGSSCDKG